MNLQALKSLIVTYPGYVDATDPSDAVIRSWLHELIPVVNGATRLGLLSAIGSDISLSDIVTTSLADPGALAADRRKHSAAHAFLRAIDAGSELLDLADPHFAAIVDNLDIEGVLPTAKVDAIKAVGDGLQRRDIAAGLQPVNLVRHIRSARELP